MIEGGTAASGSVRPIRFTLGYDDVLARARRLQDADGCQGSEATRKRIGRLERGSVAYALAHEFIEDDDLQNGMRCLATADECGVPEAGEDLAFLRRETSTVSISTPSAAVLAGARSPAAIVGDWMAGGRTDLRLGTAPQRERHRSRWRQFRFGGPSIQQILSLPWRAKIAVCTAVTIAGALAVTSFQIPLMPTRTALPDPTRVGEPGPSQSVEPLITLQAATSAQSGETAKAGRPSSESSDIPRSYSVTQPSQPPRPPLNDAFAGTFEYRRVAGQPALFPVLSESGVGKVTAEFEKKDQRFSVTLSTVDTPEPCNWLFIGRSRVGGQNIPVDPVSVSPGTNQPIAISVAGWSNMDVMVSGRGSTGSCRLVSPTIDHLPVESDTTTSASRNPQSPSQSVSQTIDPSAHPGLDPSATGTHRPDQ